jgi:hypothetical protein
MGAGWLSPWAIRDTILNKWIWKTDDTIVPAWTFPDVTSYILYNPNSANPTIKQVEHFNKILAASTTYIRSNEDLSAALPIVFTIDAQPDVPRTLTWAFDSHAQITAFTLSMAGTTAKGVYVSETFTEADGWSGETDNAFATITNIALTTRTGTGAGDTMDIGIGSKLGLANDIAAAADVFKVVKSAAATNAVDYSGAANVTAEATYDTVDVSTGAAIVNGDNFTIYYKSYMANMS